MLFVSIVVLLGMALELVVKDQKIGTSPSLSSIQSSVWSFLKQGESTFGLYTDFCICRIVEKYLESDEAEKRILEIMYGEKVLKKLLEVHEREIQNELEFHKYVSENTVTPSSISLNFLKQPTYFFVRADVC